MDSFSLSELGPQHGNRIIWRCNAVDVPLQLPRARLLSHHNSDTPRNHAVSVAGVVDFDRQSSPPLPPERVEPSFLPYPSTSSMVVLVSLLVKIAWGARRVGCARRRRCHVCRRVDIREASIEVELALNTGGRCFFHRIDSESIDQYIGADVTKRSDTCFFFRGQ